MYSKFTIKKELFKVGLRSLIHNYTSKKSFLYVDVPFIYCVYRI